MKKSLRSPVFDDIRWFFCLSLFCFHFAVAHAMNPFWFITGKEIVSAFFILSGMFTYRSFQKNSSIKKFYKRRVQRIMPPYILTILFSFFIAFFLTTKTTSQFLCDDATWHYLCANIFFLNFLQPTIPTVFADNPLPFLNASLWTMKVEVLFYLILPVLFWCIRRKAFISLISFYLLSVFYNIVCSYYFQKTGDGLYSVLQHQIFGELMYFIAGMACQCYFKKILEYKKWLFPICLLIMIVYHFTFSLVYVMPIAFALLLFLIGSSSFLSFRWKRPNLTYEVYLIHFPIIQLFIALGFSFIHPIFSFVLVLGFTFLCATLIKYISGMIVRG